MKHNSVPHFFLLVTVVFLGMIWGFGCAKPTPFGDFLLDDQAADFEFTDTLTLQCTILPEDSLITSDLSSTADYMLCGQLNDPAFGKSRSDIFTQLTLSSLDPNFTGAVLDSVVLYLRYDAKGFYGDTLQPQTLRVHRVAPDSFLHYDQIYYSTQSLPVAEQIGELANFMPKPNIGLALFDTSSKAPYIRVPLDKSFGEEIMAMDSLTLTSDTAFFRKLRGLRISAESAGQPGAMMAFDLNVSTFSRVRLFMKKDTTRSTYDLYFLGSNKFTHFSHDYSASTVEPYLNKPAEDRLFVQGMGGLRVKLTFPYAHLLDDIAINKAQLELNVVTDPGANPKLTPAGQLVFTESVGDSVVSLTSDVQYSLGPTFSNGFDLFGGTPESITDQGTPVTRYLLTLSQRFQQIVDNKSGDLKDQAVYLNVYPQSRSAMRVILNGPKNGTFPAKLSLKYTKVR